MLLLLVIPHCLPLILSIQNLNPLILNNLQWGTIFCLKFEIRVKQHKLRVIRRFYFDQKRTDLSECMAVSDPSKNKPKNLTNCKSLLD